MKTLDDGDEVEVQGSSAKYTLSRRGDVYMCSCPAWRNQGATIDRRTCKHLRAYLGDAAESARVGAALVTRAPKAKKSAADDGDVADDGDDAAAPVLLAHKWEVDHDPTGWWMSEKLDGVRAYWDGEAFQSRLGKKFYAPDWFIADLPADTLDGELWVGRKLFSKTISIVRSGAGGEAWKQVSYVVFDAPNARGGFEDRLAHVDKVLRKAGAPHARALEHVVCEGLDHLRAELARVEALGGEGLMLRRPGSPYEVGRSGSLLKVKTFHDAEAIIVGHAPGTGRHKGRLGAVIAELPDGTRFNVGTGFSDAERDDPPAVGSVITFRYQELTDDGVPRFPSWVGVRIDAEWPPRSQALPVSQAGAKSAKPAKPAPVAKPAKGEPPAPVDTVDDTPSAAADFTVSLVHPTEHKFWRVEVRGTAHYIHFGKVGTAGQTRMIELGSATAARADADKRAQGKRKDGYVAAKPR
ncbi:MAG: DNA ligase [Deltaproteobacteria bacterium]|nr:DNA ligase [Deltaproteobacteria bacterium]